MSDEATGIPPSGLPKRRPGHFDRFGIDNQAQAPIELEHYEALGSTPYRNPPLPGELNELIPMGGTVIHEPPPGVPLTCRPTKVVCAIKYDGSVVPDMEAIAPPNQWISRVHFMVTGNGVWSCVAEFES